jgi:hypothetical protein
MRSAIRAVILTGAAAIAVIAMPEFRPGAILKAAGAAQEAGQAGEETQAGFFALVGGPVRGKLVRTQTTPSALAEGPVWRPLPGAILARVVPAGTTDLFNIAFSSECQVRSLGNGDTARIRIAHLINGVAVAPVEPYDGDQRFCSSVNPVATHAGLWSRRVGAGNHTLRVEVMTTDFVPDNGAITSVFDDWTFELVVYD